MNNYTSYIERDEVWGIIPARSGSKGVKNKNIRCLKGYPLIAYAIVAAKLTKGISRVIVSTDSVYYAKIANYYGAEVPFIRPAEISGDKSTDIEFMNHAIAWFAENEHLLPEFFAHIRVTYPLREISVMEDALSRIKADKTATSLRSSHITSETPYKWFNLRKDGYYKPLMDGMTVDDVNNPRQSFPTVYIPDGYVDILRTQIIIEKHQMHGERSIGYVVPDGIDIDFMKDFDAVSHYIETHHNDLYDYLRKNFEPLDNLTL